MPSLTAAQANNVNNANINSTASMMEEAKSNKVSGSAPAKQDQQQPEQVQDGPVSQVLQVVDKKVRNLEKRKRQDRRLNRRPFKNKKREEETRYSYQEASIKHAKLDGYIADVKRGKKLLDDQQAAIDKYHEVVQALDLTKELSGQFKQLAVDEEKARKKQAKRDQQEKNKAEVKKVAAALETQELLKRFNIAKVKNDLLNGSNGAPKLTSDELASIQEFGTMVLPPKKKTGGKGAKKDNNKPVAMDYEAVADHLNNLADARSKKVGKTTYKDLKELLDKVKASGYFEASEEEPEDPETPTTSTPSEPNVEHENKKQVNGAKEEVVKKRGSPGKRQHKEKEDKKEPSPAKQQQQQPPPQMVEQQQQQQQHEQRQSPPKQHFNNNTSAIPTPMPHPAKQQQQQQPANNEQPQQPIDLRVLPHPPQQQQQQQQHPPQQQQQQQQHLDFLQESQIDMTSPHMDPAVVVVQQRAPPVPAANLGNSPPHAPSIGPPPGVAVTTAAQFLQHTQHQAQPGIPSQTFTNPMFIPTAPIQPFGGQQQQQMQQQPAPFQNQQQQQPQNVPQHHQPMPQQQQHHQQQQQKPPSPEKPVHGFPNGPNVGGNMQQLPQQQQQVHQEVPQQQPEHQQEHQPQLELQQHPQEQLEPRPANNQPPAEAPAEQQAPQKPQGYAAIAAAGRSQQPAFQQQQQQQQQQPQQQPEHDTFTNIADWNEEVGAGSSNVEETRGYRGRGGRGRGGGERRGGPRGEFRGGRGGGGERGEYRGERRGGDFRGEQRRGGDRGGRGGPRGEFRGGNRGGERGERRGGDRRGGGGRGRGERPQHQNGYGEARA